MDKKEQENIQDFICENYMNKQPHILYENSVKNYGSYVVELYLAADPEDKKYISQNRKFIKKFFDDGYQAAHLGNFMGCFNDNSVKQNTSMLKVAKDVASGQIIAMTIYSSRWGGFKCVGGTVICGDIPRELRELGKEALMNITREDVKLWNEFIWIECSGKMENMWETFGGIKIPSAYLPLFMDEKTLENVEFDNPDDPYHYSRIIQKNTPDEKRIEKIIYGFPNKDVILKYIKDRNMSLKELCEIYGKDVSEIILENVNYRVAPEKIWPDLKILMHFKDDFMRGRLEFTAEELDVLNTSLVLVHTMMEPVWKHLNNKQMTELFGLINFCMMMSNRSNVIKPYRLGELLEPEVYKFTAALRMPDAF